MTSIILVFVAALVVRLVLIAMRYTDDLSAFQNGDYTLYAIGAEHFSQMGRFDNSLFLVRPPAFPLLIAALGLNANAVLLVNALLGALVAPLTCIFARQCGVTFRLSVFAGLITAVDPTSVLSTAFLGTESLANLVLLLALILVFASLHPSPIRSRWSVFLTITAGAVAIVVSSLTRPATYLLWIVLAIWGLVVNRRQWLPVAVFAAVSLLGISAWIVHNGVVFGNYTFSTIGVYNMLYYRAASVESRGAGISIDDTYADLSRRVEAQLGHDTSAVDSGTRHRHYAATSDLQAVMQSVAIDVFTAYPLVYLATIPIGLFRILILTETQSTWLTILFAIWNALLIIGTLFGLWTYFRHRQWKTLLYIVLICAYYIAGTIVVQTSGIDTRARTMLTPLMAISTAYWLQNTPLVSRILSRFGHADRG